MVSQWPQKIRSIKSYMDLPKIDMAFERDKLNFPNNQPVGLYRGQLKLVSKDITIFVRDSVVSLEWLPRPRVTFSGSLVNAKQFSLITSVDIWKAYYEDALIGVGQILSHSISTTYSIKGELTQNIELLDKTFFDEVQFSIVNLPERLGDIVISKENGSYRGRLEVKLNRANLIIDAVVDIDERLKSLKSDGGYNITHHCALKFTKSQTGDKLKEYLEAIRLSLRILIGQDLGFVMLKFFKNKTPLSDFYIYGKPHQILNCHRLLNMHSHLSHSVFFENIFWDCINAKKDKPVSDLVHWYNMSNSNHGYVEGSLLMAQTGIELLYNWIICERLCMVTKNDAKNKISAASKIKSLMAYSGLNVEAIDVPKELKKYMVNERRQSVAETIVELRNHLVHSSEDKRSRLLGYNPIIFYEARNILLYIIERYLLAIGGYDRKYFNRLTNNLADSQDFKLTL